MRTVADRASRPLLKKEVAERWIDRTLQVAVARAGKALCAVGRCSDDFAELKA